MNIREIPLDKLVAAPWIPNHMDGPMLARLWESINRFDLVQPLVARPIERDCFEVFAGCQRLEVLQERRVAVAPVVVVDLDDVDARLLAQALDAIHGEDDLGKKAELFRTVLREVPEETVLSLLPESTASLAALSHLTERDVAAQIEEWERTQRARVQHISFQLTNAQREVVEQALASAETTVAADGANSSVRGNALFAVCTAYVDRGAR